MPCTKPVVLRKSRSSVAPTQAAVRRTMLELMEARLRDVEVGIVAAFETMHSDAQAICEKSTTYINEIILDFEHTGLLDKNFLEVIGEKESDIYAFMDSDTSSGCTVPSTPSFSSDPTTSTMIKQTKGRGRVPKKTSGQKTKPRAKRGAKKVEDGGPRGHKGSSSSSRLSRTPSRNPRSLSRTVITPKFDTRRGRTPSTARRAKAGEVLVSLSGSPVQNENMAPLKPIITLPLGNGKVLNIDPDVSRIDLEGLGKNATQNLRRLRKALTKYIEKADCR